MNFYSVLLLLHSWNRWLAVIALVATTVLAWQGWRANKPYTKRDTMLRGATVGLNHLQVIFGFVLYFQSPLVEYLRSDMLIAAIILTIGGAKARRGETDAVKFRTVAIFFTLAIVLILLGNGEKINA